jgi:ribosomal protein S27E
MKTKHIRTSLLGLAALGTLLLASCQAPSSGPKAAVHCDKCHTIHFLAPTTGGGGVGGAGLKGGFVTLRHADSMSCPDCENKVVAMLKGGSITRHTCASCGGTLRHCSHH